MYHISLKHVRSKKIAQISLKCTTKIPSNVQLQGALVPVRLWFKMIGPQGPIVKWQNAEFVDFCAYIPLKFTLPYCGMSKIMFEGNTSRNLFYLIQKTRASCRSFPPNDTLPRCWVNYNDLTDTSCCPEPVPSLFFYTLPVTSLFLQCVCHIAFFLYFARSIAFFTLCWSHRFFALCLSHRFFFCNLVVASFFFCNPLSQVHFFATGRLAIPALHFLARRICIIRLLQFRLHFSLHSCIYFAFFRFLFLFNTLSFKLQKKCNGKNTLVSIAFFLRQRARRHPGLHF